MNEEEKDLKKWLGETLPADMSRQFVAAELGVTRKTISNMLNPKNDSFANGLTMLRYLRLVGALRELPEANPESSPLARVEAKLDGLTRALDDLAAYLRGPHDEASQERGNGG